MGMRQLTVVLVMICACVIPLAGAPFAEAQAAGDLYEIRLPGMVWGIALELPGFQVVEKGTRPDQSSTMMRAENKSTGVIISVFLERERKALTSIQCRDKYWQKALRSPAKKSGVKSSENDQMALGEYVIKSYGDLQLMQKHVNAYVGVENMCVDIHLSKVQYTDDDAALFSAVLNSVQVKRADEHSRESEKLKEELASAKDKNHAGQKAAYDKNMNNLTAVEWFAKGHASFLSEDFNNAIDALTKAIELDPKFTKAYGDRGVCYGQLGKYSQALEDFNKVIELEPKNAVGYTSRGLAYHSLGNSRDAIKDFDKAIKLNPPRIAEVYFIRGLVYGEMGNPRQSIKDFDKAIKLKTPNLEEAYYKRGLAYGKLGNLRKEIKDYSKAIELNPKNAGAYGYRGLAHGKLGNSRQAIEDFDKAIELNPKNEDAYYNRGVAYHHLGNKEQALSDYKTAAKLGEKMAQDYLRKQGIDW
jgi:tetratricopeptide (TPR) repeat protein